jgi:hypothetical protein
MNLGTPDFVDRALQYRANGRRCQEDIGACEESKNTVLVEVFIQIGRLSNISKNGSNTCFH